MLFDFKHRWVESSSTPPEHKATMAMLELHVGEVNLTQNENTWSQTVQNEACLSAYPLAMWLASSWWRLMWEPLPSTQVVPPIEWRMAHELGAANHGYVWPRVIFASDGSDVQIWSVPLSTSPKQSIRYLNGLDTHAFVSISDFSNKVDGFINSVLGRLTALNINNTELAELWNILNEERNDIDSIKYRKIEASLGFDPDECPEDIMTQALELDAKIGEYALSELTPIYSNARANPQPIAMLNELCESKGIIGTPDIQIEKRRTTSRNIPWKIAVNDAQYIRKNFIGDDKAIPNDSLYELLGISKGDIDNSYPEKSNAAIAKPVKNGGYEFILRKKHPVARRFELARLVGDYIFSERNAHEKWLVSTDIGTYRQKYQRAFAAELLCPIESLKDFLEDDYSETAIEDAVDYFDVSETTVRSLLSNNGVIPPIYDYSLPYGVRR